MAVSPELLRLLACPRCKTPVALSAAGDSLVCPRCRLAYPIVDDIPVMIPEEAVALAAPAEGGVGRT